MIKKLLPYCLLVIKIDLFISILATISTAPLSPKGITFDSLSYLFFLSFFSGGFLTGVLYFEFARKQEYYFYFNLGISKSRLVLASYLFNLVVVLPLLIIAVYAGSLWSWQHQKIIRGKAGSHWHLSEMPDRWHNRAAWKKWFRKIYASEDLIRDTLHRTQTYLC